MGCALSGHSLARRAVVYRDGIVIAEKCSRCDYFTTIGLRKDAVASVDADLPFMALPEAHWWETP